MSAEAEKPYYERLRSRVKEARSRGTVYPAPCDVFAALQTPLHAVKAIILGQDPYHGPGQAHGLAFSVRTGRVPPSLRNVLEEQMNDVGAPWHGSGDLTPWAQRGVLLLNTVLTVRAGSAGSHRSSSLFGPADDRSKDPEHGWERLTGALLDAVAALDQPIVWMLWGADARRAAEGVWGVKFSTSRTEIHRLRKPIALVLTAPHPSPLAGPGFRGCRHFSAANEWLLRQGVEPIDWSL